jgi:hypothetical protein
MGGIGGTGGINTGLLEALASAAPGGTGSRVGEGPGVLATTGGAGNPAGDPTEIGMEAFAGAGKPVLAGGGRTTGGLGCAKPGWGVIGMVRVGKRGLSVLMVTFWPGWATKSRGKTT